jgi:hypothetical protein
MDYKEARFAYVVTVMAGTSPAMTVTAGFLAMTVVHPIALSPGPGGIANGRRLMR